jgi:uncharacterized protein
MSETIRMLFIICPLVFTAGLVDSIAGGGGLISIPAYIITGMPIHLVYGTNKFSAAFGTFFSVVRFIKGKRIHYYTALISALCALIGSYIGAKAALALDEKYLRYSLIIMLPVITIFIFTKKDFGERNIARKLSLKRMALLSIIIGVSIGFYDGFFGPGTGTFLILAYTGILGLNLTTASGNAKVVNLASNIAALIAFAYGNKVSYSIGIPAALFGILGNWIGSGLAVKNGQKVIRPVFIGAIILLFIKICYDMIWEFI